MQDLKEVTDSIHYENYRRHSLSEQRQREIAQQINVESIEGQESKI